MILCSLRSISRPLLWLQVPLSHSRLPVSRCPAGGGPPVPHDQGSFRSCLVLQQSPFKPADPTLQEIREALRGKDTEHSSSSWWGYKTNNWRHEGMAYIRTNLVGTGCTCDLGHDDACWKCRVVSIQSPMLRCMLVCAQRHFSLDAAPMQPAYPVLFWASYLVGCLLCPTIRDMGGTYSFVRSACYGVLHCYAIINRAKCWDQILSELNINFWNIGRDCALDTGILFDSLQLTFDIWHLTYNNYFEHHLSPSPLGSPIAKSMSKPWAHCTLDLNSYWCTAWRASGIRHCIHI